MTRGPATATLIRRALERDADAAGVTATISVDRSTAWASATFAGARHRLTVVADEGAGVSEWIDALPEADLPIRGHLVADLAVVAVMRRDGARDIILEMLTVEER